MASLDQIKEEIYAALANDNDGLDEHITALKTAMKEQGLKDVAFLSTRLPVPNREGRQLMKSYFKKRGVIVKFEQSE